MSAMAVIIHGIGVIINPVIAEWDIVGNDVGMVIVNASVDNRH